MGLIFLKPCNQEELILNLYCISFCDFNPHLSTFVIVIIPNGLLWEDNLSCPPVRDCKGENLTHSSPEACHTRGNLQVLSSFLLCFLLAIHI